MEEREGYKLTDASCDNGDPIDAEVEEIVMCTFTNERRSGMGVALLEERHP